MKFILATKQYMTQIFDEEGRVHPATVLSALPIVATQIKTVEKDGYIAVQVGAGKRALKNINKAQRGHLAGLTHEFRWLREFRGVPAEEMQRGDSKDAGQFIVGERVAVSSVSKGKGFQGVVKRHGFKGGPRSHGQKHSEREPGSIGATGPQRVLKGTRMAGRMGGDRIYVKNLKVLLSDAENSLLVLRGAVPGTRGTLVEVRLC
jgi:large subunit ribosomal protein L3